MNGSLSKDGAQQIAVEFIRKRKASEKIEVSTVEQMKDDWVIRGTCPIDLEGHPWAERFEVVIDAKGRVKTSDFALL